MHDGSFRFPGATRDPARKECGREQSQAVFVLNTTDRRDTLGVAFKVGGAAAQLRVPLDELRKLHVPLAELWRPGASELRERVLANPRRGSSRLSECRGRATGTRVASATYGARGQPAAAAIPHSSKTPAPASSIMPA
jgi:hypothetical protein